MSGAVHHPVKPDDTYGISIRFLAAAIAVMLSIFTISSHRSHSTSMGLQKEANDLWSHYQAKRIRDNQLELNADILKVVAPSNPQAAAIIATYANQHEEYTKELTEFKTKAIAATDKSEAAHNKALYFDTAEVVLEISLVMSSLYFIANRRIYPTLGIAFGMVGLISGLMGFLL